MQQLLLISATAHHDHTKSRTRPHPTKCSSPDSAGCPSPCTGSKCSVNHTTTNDSHDHHHDNHDTNAHLQIVRVARRLVQEVSALCELGPQRRVAPVDLEVLCRGLVSKAETGASKEETKRNEKDKAQRRGQTQHSRTILEPSGRESHWWLMWQASRKNTSRQERTTARRDETSSRTTVKPSGIKPYWSVMWQASSRTTRKQERQEKESKDWTR
jgi:hypothetical protein